MPIYKYNPSPASTKRKAEDIDDSLDLDQRDRLTQGRVTKKAKPTCGYVPGTGERYRGTAREMPNPKVRNGVGVPSTCDDTLADSFDVEGYEPTEPRGSQKCAARSHRPWLHQVSSAQQE